MGQCKKTVQEIKDLLKLRNRRVRLELEKFQGIDKFVFYVEGGKELHFFRSVIHDLIPLGFCVDVKRLRFWECRFKKIQLPEGF